MRNDIPEEGQKRGYSERQTQHDREYVAAWDDAPLEFKKQAAMLGLQPDVPDTTGMAMEYNDNYSATSHTPDMAAAIDDFADQILEELDTIYHFTPEQRIFASVIVRFALRWIQKPMDEEIMRNRSNLLARVAMFLIQDEKGNLYARIHALLHSIPRLPIQNGFPSMRASAKLCKVSPEWLRRKRDSWCDALELERPASGTKSEAACLKYRSNAVINHWRNQKWKRNYERQNNNGTNGTGNYLEQQYSH